MHEVVLISPLEVVQVDQFFELTGFVMVRCIDLYIKKICTFTKTRYSLRPKLNNIECLHNKNVYLSY